MKKHALLFCMLSVIAFSEWSSAQVNYLDNNPVWRIEAAEGSSYPCIWYQDFNYFINGDTVINSFHYKKVFKQGNYWYALVGPGSGCNGSGSIPSFLTYFIRQDGKKLFIYDPSVFGNGDTLLYDFDLQVGDTLPLSFNNYDSTIVVTSIDSVLVGSEYRKKFYLTWNALPTFIIEGVGHRYGFFEPINPYLNIAYDLDQ